MSETNHLSDLWGHTIVKVFKHDLQSQAAVMIREWAIFNKLEIFNSLLNYSIDDFTPPGILCYYKENGEILNQTPLQERFNLRGYIQHLVDVSDDEIENPLSKENWMKQTNGKFIKHAIHNKHSMTSVQLKKKPFKQIIKIQHVIQRKGSQTKMKRNLPHLQKCQNKILHLTQLLMIHKNQILQKYNKFIMFFTNQHMMKMIHIKMNM